MHSKTMRNSGLLVVALLLSTGFTADGRADNTCLDFSNTNPSASGNWSYGWTPTLTGSLFSPYTDYTNPDLQVWWHDSHQFNAFHNPTGSTNFGPITLGPGECGFHPGPNGEYSIYRWTAPAAGAASISATFYGDAGTATTQVAVVHNNVTILFNDLVNLNGLPNQTSMAQEISVAAGDWVDFKVGHGGNGYIDDATRIDGTVILDQPTPVAPRTWGHVKAIYR